MQLEFACTAMRRPGIARDTFASFAANLRGVDFCASTLYLNIDPMPLRGDGDGVVEAALEHFGQVQVNTPTEPCFPAAVKWCWTRPAGEHFFHLEDDWILLRPLHVGEMLDLLQADPKLSVVNCRAYSHDDGRICLAPGLWRSAHARVLAERLRTDANPERQLRPRSLTNPHGGAQSGYAGVQFPRGQKEQVIRDIGRTWMQVNGLRRVGDRNFIRWA
jgi:hypothetical protein